MASSDVEFGVDLENVGLVLVRQDLRQLDHVEIFVQNFLKVNFFFFGQFFFSVEEYQFN